MRINIQTTSTLGEKFPSLLRFPGSSNLGSWDSRMLPLKSFLDSNIYTKSTNPVSVLLEATWSQGQTKTIWTPGELRPSVFVGITRTKNGRKVSDSKYSDTKFQLWIPDS